MVDSKDIEKHASFGGALGAVVGFLVIIPLVSSPAHAIDKSEFTIKKVIAATVGTFTGAVIGSAAGVASVPAVGPAAPGVGAVAGLASATITGKLTKMALDHPSAAYKIMSDPVGSAIKAVTPKTGLAANVAKVLAWIW